MAGLLSYDLFVEKTSGGNIWFTPEGGLAVKYINDTGAPSIKGTIVCASPLTDYAVSLAPAFSTMAIGVIYEDGVEPNCMVRVVISGKAVVLLKDGSAAVPGYWSGVSDVSGRMYQLQTPESVETRFRQIGYSLEQKEAGFFQLSLVNLIFN
jgi:hypothetical protein